MRYDPTEALKARKVELVCRWVATTSTLGTTAPAASVIKPVMAPRSPCAKAGEARHRSAIDTAASKNRLMLIISFAGTTETPTVSGVRSVGKELTRAPTPVNSHNHHELRSYGGKLS